MRGVAEAKMGFYPVRPGTIAYVVQDVLQVDDPARTFLLDPCCGEGVALADLAVRLGVPKSNTFGVELDEKRASKAVSALGTLCYASFFAVRVVPVRSFGCVWLNPPYENEHRQEDASGRPLEAAFVEEAFRCLTPNGVLLLHMPFKRMHLGRLPLALAKHFLDLRLIRLPADLSPYGDALIVGTRRKEALREGWAQPTAWEGQRYRIPTSVPPRQLEKLEMTHEERSRYLQGAKCWTQYVVPEPLALPRPPQPMNAGHLGLMLAAGQLDGHFAPARVQSHIVKGIARKVEYPSKQDEQISPDGRKVTITTTISQRVSLRIRCLTRTGRILDMKDIEDATTQPQPKE